MFGKNWNGLTQDWPGMTNYKIWGYRCLRYGHLTLYFTTGRSNTYYFNELNLSRLYVYDVINHGYEVSILIMYTIILCSKFNDSLFCTSCNVNKLTNKTKKAYNKQQSINLSTFWSDANDNGDAAFKLDQYE
jgi:hypothetical protein